MQKLIDLVRQVFKFGIVGIICFVIDFCLMIFLTDALKINYIISCCISFCAANIVNYILSMKYVFTKNKSTDKRLQFIIFLAMSIVGLILTELLMMLFVEKFLVHYTFSKLIVTLIVMCYNFISRKLIFEKKRSETNE